MSFDTEFPDYPASDMPALPKGFYDSSWHNDVCPSYSNGDDTLHVFMDYVDLDKRELQHMSRFVIHVLDSDGDLQTTFESDDWNQILQFIDAWSYWRILSDDSEPRASLHHAMRAGQIVKTLYSKGEAYNYIVDGITAQIKKA